MKICDNCGKEINRPKSQKCLLCYQKNYRQLNRKLCQQRSKISRLKRLEHYKLKTRQRYRIKHNQPIDKPMTKRAPGEGNIHSQGYKTITKKGHPNQMDSKGRIREHIYIMSKHLGRPLFKDESVHHKNGDRLDNSIENLELWSKGQPPGQRVEDKIKYYIDFLKRYGYKIDKGPYME
jgi:hypothetical protein